MPDTKRCAECGTPLPAYWPRGLCAQCALDGALEMTHAASQILQPETPATPASLQAPSVSTDHSPVGSFGDYDLLEEIARGGMGVVYKARQRKLGRIVAVKMIQAGPLAGKEFVQRFRTESAAAAILQHSNIVAIHDVGVHEGRHYFSAGYIDGCRALSISITSNSLLKQKVPSERCTVGGIPSPLKGGKARSLRRKE